MTLNSAVTAVGTLATRPIAGLGSYLIFLGETLKRIAWPRLQMPLIFRQMEFVGNQSFGIVALSGMMVGAVFGFQLGEIFRIFKAESMLGAAASYAMSKELAPVVAAFLVTGRAGSSMAAEIATMRVNEQIDAMRVMAVNPYNYLVAPRVVSSVFMMPLLAGLFLMSGVLAAYAVGSVFYHVSAGVFLDKIKWVMDGSAVAQGLEKAALFGVIFSSIGCYKGFYAQGGAKGVGRATTQAVVYSLVTILIADFIMSYVQFRSASLM